MSNKLKKTSSAELKVRALQAKQKLRDMGINYCMMLTNKDSELSRERIYGVANGRSVDESITVMLEELVQIQQAKAVA